MQDIKQDDYVDINGEPLKVGDYVTIGFGVVCKIAVLHKYKNVAVLKFSEGGTTNVRLEHVAKVGVEDLL